MDSLGVVDGGGTRGHLESIELELLEWEKLCPDFQGMLNFGFQILPITGNCPIGWQGSEAKAGAASIAQSGLLTRPIRPLEHSS